MKNSHKEILEKAQIWERELFSMQFALADFMLLRTQHNVAKELTELSSAIRCSQGFTSYLIEALKKLEKEKTVLTLIKEA